VALPAVVEFQENLKQWMAEPPTVEQMTIIGSYRLSKLVLTLGSE
jgi:hypothetical protein